MILKLRYERKGEHVHVDVFVAAEEGLTFANAGRLVLHIGEWQLIGAAIGLGARQTHGQLTVVSEGTLNPAEEKAR